jgi:hypothetical protein
MKGGVEEALGRRDFADRTDVILMATPRFTTIFLPLFTEILAAAVALRQVGRELARQQALFKTGMPATVEVISGRAQACRFVLKKLGFFQARPEP